MHTYVLRALLGDTAYLIWQVVISSYAASSVASTLPGTTLRITSELEKGSVLLMTLMSLAGRPSLLSLRFNSTCLYLHPPPRRRLTLDHMAPLRLAILEADTPVPRVKKKYESYTGVFTALFTAAAAPAHLESVARVTGHHVVHDEVPRTPYPALDDVDAVLITGSRHNAYEDQPWILELVGFTRRCLDTARVRVVGVCFGHQIVARALGMKVGVNPKGWEVSVTETELGPTGKEIFGMEKMVGFRFLAMMGHMLVSCSTMTERTK